MLADALDRLRNQRRPTPMECAVLVCLPIGSVRFLAARHLPHSWRSALGLESDYAEQIAREFNSHADYDREVGIELRSEINNLASTGVRVSFKGTFELFSRTIRQEHSVVIVIAHHAEDGIEFYDAVYSWESVQTDLRAAHDPVTCALVLIVCESEGWKMDLAKCRVGTGALAAYLTEISPLDSVRFVREWVTELNGKRTLFEAMDRATRKLWNMEIDR